VATLDHTDPPFTSRAPRLGSFEPALFLPAASWLTAGVPIGNGNIFHSQGSCLFFIGPGVKSSVGCHPSWNSTQFALVACDRGPQQVLIAGSLFEHLVVSDLVLRFLKLDHIMKKIADKAGGLKRKVRDRTRSVSKRVIAIAQAVRQRDGW
jgi:hypothetical protein